MDGANHFLWIFKGTTMNYAEQMQRIWNEYQDAGIGNTKRALETAPC